ncbi:hypothetical protein BRADI_4g39727v3 [Brachypodium distachyon]|uniref:Bifunctional inhibitor/plant lipid transfer protein/seed storage helical domain-containing protein n=1 Tax=Brachypodium distachyon TaxID=15368 RepID=A0A0Q3EWD4_BRADI|nr:hypothetical protein BRADI_4g39727v3 [Brachypodium distachyon]
MPSAKAARLLCLLVAISCSSQRARAKIVDQREIDKKAVMYHCWKNIEKQMGDQFPKKDSPCCQTVARITDIRGICENTAVDLALISLAKLVHVTKVCGNPIPANSNCAG